MSVTAIWFFVLYLIYLIQRSNELSMRQTFIRIKDKNAVIKDKTGELTKAQDVNTELQRANSSLEADNERIRNEIAISGMTKMQVLLVEENAGDIEGNVPPELKLDWRTVSQGQSNIQTCIESKLTKSRLDRSVS